MKRRLAVLVLLFSLLTVEFGIPITICAGSPIANSLLEIVLNDVQIKDEVVVKSGIQKAPESTTILVVNVRIRVLDNVKKTKINIGDIAIRPLKGEVVYPLKGFGSSKPGEPIWLDNSFRGWSINAQAGKVLAISLVFIVEDDAIEQEIRLHFPDIAPIPFTANVKEQ